MKRCKQQLKTSGEQIFDIAFHPNAEVVAMATITGLVEVVRYGVEDKTPLLSAKLYDASCRGLLFSQDGEMLYTISSEKSIRAINGGGGVVIDVPNAHDTSINKLTIVDNVGSAPLLITGDDFGRVNAWDFRTGVAPVMTWKLHDDYISDFCYHSDSQTLFTAAGDACLGVYDFRKRENCVKSLAQESELMSLEVIKNGRKVVCGTDDGTILVFSWGKWEDCSDRYPGHPDTIDDMLKIDENSIFTGSSDGKIRVVGIHPNKFLGVLGDHGYFPVEGLRRSGDNRVLGTFSHDNKVRLWDISIFADDVDDTVDDETGNMVQADAAEGEDGDEDVDMGAEGDEWDDCSDDSDDEEEMVDGNDEEDNDDDSDDSDDDVAVKSTSKRPNAKGGKLKGGRGFYDDL